GTGARTAGGEDGRVDRVRDQGQADDHLEGARPQQQPHAAGHQHADRDRQHEFHQLLSSVVMVPSAPTTVDPRGRRSDWWARATSINVVAPTTRQNTRRANSTAEASGLRPNTGSSAWRRWVVRNGWSNTSAAGPVTTPTNRPAGTQRTGSTRRWVSTQRAPRAMYSSSSATDTVSPAAKPPPGRSWPRRNRCSPNSSTTGNIALTIKPGISR